MIIRNALKSCQNISRASSEQQTYKKKSSISFSSVEFGGSETEKVNLLFESKTTLLPIPKTKVGD